MKDIKLIGATYYKECPVCGYDHRIKLNENDITDRQKIDYDFRAITGKLIQDIFPNLNNTEREFLKSGTCTKCQRKLFNKKASSRKIRIV
ncbi:MAG: hypothetical protein IJP08_03360 [Bacteroidaceae bacterium]|nr:hypothetical protein [Bacteroidaceae bacterium]